jgi:hypothetical protein
MSVDEGVYNMGLQFLDDGYKNGEPETFVRRIPHHTPFFVIYARDRWSHLLHKTTGSMGS